jgi:hypothetical protein
MLEQPPRWLPDWRDAAAYPTPGSPSWISANQWRWEFQRRDPAYQRDWVEFTKLAAIYGIDPDTPAGDLKMRLGPRFKALVDKYGMLKPIDPASPSPPLFVQVRRLAISPPGQPIEMKAIRLEEGTALVQIDLRQPLAPQLTKTRGRLLALTADWKPARLAQWRPERWLTYLRLLDADACAATKDEISRVLYPNLENDYPHRNLDARLRDDRRAAQKLCRGDGYTRIM